MDNDEDKIYTEPFICGVSGDQDPGGLYQSYMICPMPGSDNVGMYTKSPHWHEYNAKVIILKDTKAIIVCNSRGVPNILVGTYTGEYWINQYGSRIEESKILYYSTDLYNYFNSRYFWKLAFSGDSE